MNRSAKPKLLRPGTFSYYLQTGITISATRTDRLMSELKAETFAGRFLYHRVVIAIDRKAETVTVRDQNHDVRTIPTRKFRKWLRTKGALSSQATA
jgi:hypothetical protein